MPYITQKARDELIGDTKTRTPGTPGELNYMFTVLADEYLNVKGRSYTTFQEVFGALEGAKLELYRRQVAAYEDQKCFDNGDVYSDY